MNPRIEYDPSQTIYTDTSDDQGLLTAHILTNTEPLNPTNAKPSIKCYYDTLDELHAAVKEHYGQPAVYVDRITFRIEMSRRGMREPLEA